MQLTGENPYLCRCLNTRRLNDAASAHAASIEPVQQSDTGFVLTHQSDERDLRAERGEIDRTVGRSAGNGLRPLMPQNKHGRFARHAANLAIKKTVGHSIANHHDAPLRKATDNHLQPLHLLSRLKAHSGSLPQSKINRDGQDEIHRSVPPAVAGGCPTLSTRPLPQAVPTCFILSILSIPANCFLIISISVAPLQANLLRPSRARSATTGVDTPIRRARSRSARRRSARP